MNNPVRTGRVASPLIKNPASEAADSANTVPIRSYSTLTNKRHLPAGLRSESTLNKPC